jgi:hypothetical protein
VPTGTGAPIHLVNQNVGSSQAIESGVRIELFFDRLLLPSTVTRQSFVLQDIQGNYLEPQIAYDPVARVVQIIPDPPLTPGQLYTVTIVVPAEAGADGLRAIDGATLVASDTKPIEFQVVGSLSGGPDAGSPSSFTEGLVPVDYCSDIQQSVFNECLGSNCHGGMLPAEGLNLSSPLYVASTAINRVSEESNQGPAAAAQPPSSLFGLDMPIVDRDNSTTGEPGDSWMIYKLLLASPSPCTEMDGGIIPCFNPHSEPWQPISESERAVLANYVIGREMPFPQSDPNIDDASAPVGTLTTQMLEALSYWMLEGAPVPSCGN